MKSWKKPTLETVDKALTGISQVGQYRYFLERLENPEWLDPLAERGVFLQSPEPVRDSDRGTISFPVWPQSAYLTKIAAHKPIEVARIIETLSSTENMRVIEDFLNALCKMPTEISIGLKSSVVRWAGSVYLSMVAEKIVQLLAKWAHDGEFDAALSVSKTLFALSTPPVERVATADGREIERRPDPTGRIASWQYGKALSSVLSALIKANAQRAIDFATGLLAAAISSKRHSGERDDDYSYIWRPAIEDHEQNVSRTYRDEIVNALRDNALAAVSQEYLSCERVIQLIERKEESIFKRIALHVLAMEGSGAKTLTAQKILNYELFDNYRFRHEYVSLIRKQLGNLSRSDQDAFRTFIARGPDIERLRRRSIEQSGEEITPDQIVGYTKRWRRDRLAWLGDQASGEEKEELEALEREVGQTEHPEFTAYTNVGWVGPLSPISAEELSNLPIDRLRQFVSEWKSTGHWKSPTSSGLARILEEVIKKEPAKFAEQADKFIGLHPIYIQAIVSAFASVIRNDEFSPGLPILRLSAWIVDQREIAGNAHADWTEQEVNWREARKEVARLLNVGLEKSSFSPDAREFVWNCVKLLAEDSDPTFEEESDLDDAAGEATTTAINTVRGEAMQAVLQYGLWVARQNQATTNEGNSSDFGGASEIQDVLDRHLRIDHDSSFAVRSVYGQFYPWIALLSRRWADENSDRIFPASDDQISYWRAAWEAYIEYCAPYDDVLPLLYDKYSLAIVRLGIVKDKDLSNYAAALAGHLMTFYWRGKLGLDDEPIRLFWDKASPDDHREALGFIGRSLKDAKEKLPHDVIQRLEVLWDNRMVETTKKGASDKSLIQLLEFGAWFPSDQFDEQWRLDRLLGVLRVTKSVEADDEVLRALAAMGLRHPREVAQCLELIVQGSENTWKMQLWSDEIAQVLHRVLQAEDKQAREIGRRIVNILASQGYYQFAPLLKLGAASGERGGRD